MSKQNLKADPYYTIGRIEGIMECVDYNEDKLAAIKKVLAEFEAARKAKEEDEGEGEGEGGAE